MLFKFYPASPGQARRAKAIDANFTPCPSAKGIHWLLGAEFPTGVAHSTTPAEHGHPSAQVVHCLRPRSRGPSAATNPSSFETANVHHGYLDQGNWTYSGPIVRRLAGFGCGYSADMVPRPSRRRGSARPAIPQSEVRRGGHFLIASTGLSANNRPLG